jgi:hypothetical protein
MSVPNKTKGIDVGFDATFIQNWLKYQKYAWIFMVVVVAAGLAGLSGRGPFSRTKLSSPSGQFTVEYDRIARNKTPALIVITIQGEATGRPIRLRLQGNLLNAGGLQRMVPPPAKVEPLTGGILADWPANHAATKRTIMLNHEPRAPGEFVYTISLNDGSALELHQWVMP